MAAGYHAAALVQKGEDALAGLPCVLCYSRLRATIALCPLLRGGRPAEALPARGLAGWLAGGVTDEGCLLV